MPNPGVDTLRRLRTLNQFSDAQLEALARELTVQSASHGERLVERGCLEQFGLYLLSGSIVTIAKDGTRKEIHSLAEGDINPVAHIRPSMYDVDALGDIEYLKISTELLTGFAQLTENDSECDDFEVVTIEQTEEEVQLIMRLFQEITSGKVSLPSLPDVARRIQQAFSQPQINAEAVGRIIQSDPAITAKLIMVANSPFYGGRVEINSLQQAIVRIGLDSTRKLVLTYAIKELFKASTSGIRDIMHKLWKHSRRVAAFSRVLARQSKLFDPEQAQLAGLVHDLGEIAILQFVQENPEFYEDETRLMQAIRNLRPQITGMLLGKWNFTDEMIKVGEESEEWFRNPANEPDLCDLVLIAQYHSYIGSEEIKGLPPVFKLPAFSKLGLEMDKPAQILEFVRQSKADVEVIEKLLGTV